MGEVELLHWKLFPRRSVFKVSSGQIVQVGGMRRATSKEWANRKCQCLMITGQKKEYALGQGSARSETLDIVIGLQFAAFIFAVMCQCGTRSALSSTFLYKLTPWRDVQHSCGHLGKVRSTTRF